MFKKVLSIYLACGLGVMIARWTDPEAKEKCKKIRADMGHMYPQLNESALNAMFATANAIASFGCIMKWPVIVARTWMN